MPRFDLFSSNEDGIYFRIALLRGRSSGLTITAVPSLAGALTQFIDTERFEIISDVTYSLGDLDTNGMNKRFHRRTHRVMKTVIFDNGNTDQVITNPYFYWIWTNDVISTGENFRGVIRIYYTDI